MTLVRRDHALHERRARLARHARIAALAGVAPADAVERWWMP
jgi:hypothetical protein